MANNIFRIKRRASGLAGAPTSLLNAELAFNEVDNILYIGKGTGAGDIATTIEAIAGRGAFVSISDDQTITGSKTFANSPEVPTLDLSDDSNSAASTAFVKAVVAQVSTPDGDKGDITVAAKGTSWTINPSSVTLAKIANIASGTFIGRTAAGSGAPQALTAAQVKAALALGKGDVGLGNVDNTSDAAKPISTATQTALNTKAPLANPEFTGVPKVPTAAPGTSTTQAASTAFVQTAVAALVEAAPEALNTLNELAAAIGDDPNFAATITTSIGEKVAKSANLSDLTNVATARNNLGLKTMATQASNSVSITGGTVAGVTVSNVVIDCGTF